VGNSQMSMAGLAQDESDEETSVEEEIGSGSGRGRARGMAGRDGSASASASASVSTSGLDSGVDAPGSEVQEQRKQGHLARKNVLKALGKRPIVPRSKMQIMASVEVDDEEEDDDQEGENYDYGAVQDIVEGRLPLARGGTEESEGGDYNPLLDVPQSTAARRSSSGPREKRMKY
jgi:hypothetical protein